jgi:hypothetical protein
MKRSVPAYKNFGCGDPPGGAERMCDEPYPEPVEAPLYPFPPPDPKAATATGAAATMIILMVVILLVLA